MQVYLVQLREHKERNGNSSSSEGKQYNVKVLTWHYIQTLALALTHAI